MTATQDNRIRRTADNQASVHFGARCTCLYRRLGSFTCIHIASLRLRREASKSAATAVTSAWIGPAQDKSRPIEALHYILLQPPLHARHCRLFAQAGMSGRSTGGGRGYQPKAPEKGVFPLDHFGECKQVRACHSQHDIKLIGTTVGRGRLCICSCKTNI